MGLAAAVVLALCAQDAPKPAAPGPAPLRPPPARAAVAGLRGFESRSRLAYGPRSDQPHELRSTYVFPARVRWWIAADDRSVTERRLRYRYGEHVLAVEPRSAASVEYVREDRDALLGAFELRRALFLWPDGFEWKGDGEVRTADLPGLGTLRARLGPEKRPTEMTYVDRGGEEHDAYRAVSWRAGEPRTWPSAMELWNSDTFVWRESVESVDVETRWIDSFFVPPDRRGVAGAPVAGVRALDIPPTCSRRVALRSDIDWEAAREERRKLVAEARAAGLDVEEWATFEVNAQGAPAAAILRLSKPPEKVPEGYVAAGERLGLALAVHGLSGIEAQVLERLRGGVPEGGLVAPAYVRFQDRGEVADVVVVVPYD